MKKLILNLIILTILICNHINISLGCECDLYSTEKSEFEKASAVFIGKFIAVEKSNNDNYAGMFRFKVIKYWKGITTKDVVIYTNYYGCNNLYFYENEEYVIFSYKDKGGYLFTHFCTYNRYIAHYEEKMIIKQFKKNKFGKAKTIKN